MKGTRSLSGTADVVNLLTALGDEVAENPDHADRMPEELVRSARRFVDLTGLDALPGESVTVVATRDLPTSQLVVQLVRPGEIVNAGKLRGRLARAGRIVEVSSINTTLHRAWKRGVLDRVSSGHYSRVIGERRPGIAHTESNNRVRLSPDRVARMSRNRRP